MKKFLIQIDFIQFLKLIFNNFSYLVLFFVFFSFIKISNYSFLKTMIFAFLPISIINSFVFCYFCYWREIRIFKKLLEDSEDIIMF